MPFFTFTGVDDTTHLEDLTIINRALPFGIAIEWGVLYNTRLMGMPGYPTVSGFNTLVKNLSLERRFIPMSLHICGKDVSDFLKGEGQTSEIVGSFNRVQLNYQFSRYDIELLTKTLAINEKTHRPIITQYNGENHRLWSELWEYKNHQVLFDYSRGRGEIPLIWPKPIKGLFCGYAGGFTVDNLCHEIMRIQSTTNQYSYWVDIEEGVKNEEHRLDLSKVKECLRILEYFFNGICPNTPGCKYKGICGISKM